MHEGDLWPALRENWHAVAFSDNLGEKPVSVRLLDEHVVLCRLGGRVSAFQDLCIHRGCPISLGWVEGEELVCAYHGWSYAGDGKCTRIPSVPSGHPIPYLAEELHLKGPDAVAIAYRRFMAELGVDIDAREPERVG